MNSNISFTQVVDATHRTAPYRLNLNYGFMPGHELTIMGVPSYSADRFHVNFMSQSYNNQDVAFHFNPRFNQNAVVRNSQFAATWGNEERDGHMILHRGQTFTINFRCGHDGFRVYINGRMFTLYRHRQAPGLISHVLIDGAVSITTLTYHASVSGMGGKPSVDIQLQNSFTPNCELTVTGQAPPYLDRFAVNLNCGQGPHVDKLLHFNPRLREGVVVRNSYLDGGWGGEERDGGMMIRPGTTFTLLVRCEPDGFKIYVNGKMMTFYVHRRSPHRITSLEITDGVTINSVSYHSKMAGIPFNHVTSFYLKPAPYSVPLTHSFLAGSEITIQGTAHYGAERFHIDLRADSSGPRDIAFHLNPRFNEGVIVRNSFLGEAWGPEERDGDLPIVPGEPFTISIHSEQQEYKVIINSTFFTSYQLRHASALVTHVDIAGGVNISAVTYQAMVVGVGFMHSPSTSLVLTNGFPPGSEVEITGKALHHADRFDVNLVSEHPPETTLHFNPRFNEGAVVRNTFSGAWGAEERHGGQPFRPGDVFTLRIVCEDRGYKIFVGGNLFTFYAHRAGPDTVSSLNVNGGVELLLVTYKPKLPMY